MLNILKIRSKVFENLNDQLQSDFDNQVETSVSWIIYNKQGIVEENSGFNGFNGGSKLSKANNSREKNKKIIDKYEPLLLTEELDKLYILRANFIT